MKTFLITILLFSIAQATPRSPYNESEKEEMLRQGKMLTIQLRRSDPIRIFVLGREEAQIDPKTLKLKVRRISPYPAKNLPLRFDGTDYIIGEGISRKEIKEIEITTDVNKSQEKFNFKIED